jgi:hypothetical protein
MSQELHDQINAELKAFQEKQVEFINRQSTKKVVQAAEDGNAAPLFSKEALGRHDYIKARDLFREQAVDSGKLDENARSLFLSNDRADQLTDTFSHSGLRSMENSGLLNARLAESPWSDDYWAIYLGMLGKRYADPGFPKSSDWKVNFDYIQRNPAAAVLASGNQQAINTLSPSEKYDILVGDRNYSLTQQMWEEGRFIYQRYGHVEGWMGICHGWAPAAYMLDRPVNPVTVLAADGRTWLTFYPSDIKALASLLWAKAAPRAKFIGGRCNISNPQVDPQTGRILAQECFDTNPGTWHLAVVNQIGVSRRSMVMDATFDYEVWNQPVLAYSYTYFNPASNMATGSLAAATIAKAHFTNDRFAAYRGSQTDSIVGIEMNVEYIVETRPSHSAPDGPHRDGVNMATYRYDLELDFSGRIIGGEWHGNQNSDPPWAHPDFLWTPARGARALPPWEARNPINPADWSNGQPIPSIWQQIAAITSAYSKAPMAAITERLIQLAN